MTDVAETPEMSGDPIQTQEEADALQARIEQAKAAFPEDERPEVTNEFLKIAEEKLAAWNADQNTVIAGEVNVNTENTEEDSLK